MLAFSKIRTGVQKTSKKEYIFVLGDMNGLNMNSHFIADL